MDAQGTAGAALEGVAIKGEGVDAAMAGQVAGKLAEGLAPLAAGAFRVGVGVVVEGDSEVDEGLEEEALGARRADPFLLPGFVGVEVAPGGEQSKSLIERGVHIRIIEG